MVPLMSRAKFLRSCRLFAAVLAALLGGGELVSPAAFAQGEGFKARPFAPLGQESAPRDPKAATAKALKKALAPKPEPEAMRKQKLDTLFERLRDAHVPEDAQQIAALIEHLWLQSSSDTAALLMQRATASLEAQDLPLALSLLNKLVVWDPGWAEAWNARARARFMTGDLDGAMADINHVLRLEPRHFGALAGMGMILQQEGFDTKALEVFNKALAIYPLAPDIRNLAGKLTREVEGQDI